MTGIGFIGAGLVFHAETGGVQGITSAAGIFAVAAVGVVCGYGHLALATLATALVLLALELDHIPLLRQLDAGLHHRRKDSGPDDPTS